MIGFVGHKIGVVWYFIEAQAGTKKKQKTLLSLAFVLSHEEKDLRASAASNGSEILRMRALITVQASVESKLSIIHKAKAFT